MMMEPDAPASIVASGLNPSVPIIGAATEAAVITPTVVEPVTMLPAMPNTNGRKMAGSPVESTKSAMASTAGVSRRIWLSAPPSPVTMMIIADARSASSIQASFRSLAWLAFVFRYASKMPMPRATTGHPR